MKCGITQFLNGFEGPLQPIGTLIPKENNLLFAQMVLITFLNQIAIIIQDSPH